VTCILDDDVNVNDASLIEYSSAEGLPTLPLIVAERGPPAYLM